MSKLILQKPSLSSVFENTVAPVNQCEISHRVGAL